MQQLWDNARTVANAAMRRADQQVFGTPRAQARYTALPAAVQTAMRETVVEELGQASWDDFEAAIGGQQDGGR